MSQITLIERLPTPQEYNDLRQAVGWRVHRQESIEKGFANTWYGVCAYVDGELVGMARILGDDGLAYYIHDVIVVPSHQQKGIGRQIMDQIMHHLHAHGSPNATIGLMAALDKETFYEPYGFTRRPNAKFGSGMTMHLEG